MLIVSITLPSGIFLVQPVAGKALASSSQLTAQHTTLVSVVQPVSQTTVVTGSAIAVSCITDAKQTANLVQDSSLVNLNVPSNCFTLSFAQITAQSLALTVQPLADAVHHIVVPSAQLQAPVAVTLPGQGSHGLPLLPAAIFFLIIGFEAWSHRRRFVLASRDSFARLSNNVFLQFKILRC